ncbi:PREDICTED: solute carrier family 2, facilitated glucose transporter member 9-like [Crocodylus porosus]|uniref:solute carrier family 2, facilitated glucose transporter member 9-like n=1 Tax=Crocodylus porosus TaxID=8502 RepID=UPI00093C9900|nr:PREDICTED: solute carrier family 2, facilitated glucose transporter member 9-like [Crocodylus porosus]
MGPTEPSKGCGSHDAAKPLTFPLLSVTLLASFGSSMLYGYNLAVVNSPAVHIKAFYNLTWTKRYGQGLSPGLLTLMYSLTVSVFALGGLVGSLPVGVLVTRYGRNGTLVRSTLLVFLASALMGFSRALASPEMIITGRFITGIHSGVCLSVVPMYLGEIAPKNLRGFLGLVPSIFICLGVFSAQLLGLPELLGEDGLWPLFLSVVAVPAFLQLLLLRWFPESPRYLLIEKNDVCSATQALRWFLGKQDVREVVEEMREEQRSLSSVQTVSVRQLLQDRSVRWQVLSVVVINVGMQLSGIDAIWFYTNTIFENAGIPAPEVPYTTVATGAIEVVAGLVGCFTIERLGRRPLIIVGFCFMSICSLGITISLVLQTAVPWMRYVSVACVVGIIAGFCIGPAGVPFLMTAELFKQSHRPAAYIVGGSLNWLSNFAVGFVFPFLQMSAGAFCYLVFCGVCLLVALYVHAIIPETKNKTFVEISHIFASRRAFLARTPDLVRMSKLHGYGALESSSLEDSGSSQA